jgi:hypothetical protein
VVWDFSAAGAVMLAQIEKKANDLIVRTILSILVILPWVIVDIVLKKHETSRGYTSGIIIGLSLCYIVSGRIKWHVLLMIEAIFVINYFVIMP